MAQPAVDPKAFYGYLFQNNKQPTKVLNALLRGIANYISTNIGDPHEKTLTPAKLAAFYKAVGGNYDSLFVDVPYPSISWIYASIGCQHTLQPTDLVFDPPSIPALTTRGFVNWQSIEILLGPEEHVPFMQYAVRNFAILHPETGERFPPELTIDAFPLVADPVIVKWHSDCAEKLRRRATPVEERPDLPPRPKVYVDTRAPHTKRPSAQSKRRPESYFDSRSTSFRRDINFKHVPGAAVPGAGDRPVRPKLSGSPTHRAREFLAPEALSPDSPRLSRSRRRSVPENMNSPLSSPRPAVSPEAQSPNTDHIRRHSHPRQQRRNSMSSDASSEREDPPSPVHVRRRAPPRSNGPEIRFQSPTASPQAPTPPPPPPDARFKARVGDDIEDYYRRKYTIPIDQSGKLSAPFLLGKRDGDRPRSNSKGSNVRWQDLTNGHDIWRREKSSEEEREGKPRRRVSRGDIDRDIDRDSGSGGGSGSRSDHKRPERDPGRERPVRHSSQDDSPREREWEDVGFRERERNRDRERRPTSPPVRGVDGRFYPPAR